MNRGYRLTATGSVPGRDLKGFYVASTNAGTIVFRHTSSTGAQISGEITPAVGWHDYPVTFDGGALHITIGGTALDVTFMVE